MSGKSEQTLAQERTDLALARTMFAKLNARIRREKGEDKRPYDRTFCR